MSQPAAADPVEVATVSLHIAQPGAIEIDRASALLEDLTWLGYDHGHEKVSRTRQVVVDLKLPILDGSAEGPVRKEVLIELGPARPAGTGVILEIAWRSLTLSPMFPVFAGSLRVSPDGLRLDGRYAPPFGRIGLLLDRALLHVVARRTATALLARLAAALAA